jgi:putative tryptophan/tyrosine transport system substrate-binding protein
VEAFRLGLRELGYVEGQNILIEYRYAEGKQNRLPDLAADLVRLKVDIIVAQSTETVLAAKSATSTIPIVMTNSADPIGSGLVASLARPGGNVTGMSLLAGLEISGKQLELLKETVPKLSRVAVLANPASRSSTGAGLLREAEPAARALGVQIFIVEARDASELEGAFSAMKKARAGAFLMMPNPIFQTNRRGIAALAASNRIPAMYPYSSLVDAGGLMSYGANLADTHRRAATYVDKILKGAKPADLPVEQPMKFEFIINLNAAKQIGLTIPPNVLVRADKVIK